MLALRVDQPSIQNVDLLQTRNDIHLPHRLVNWRLKLILRDHYHQSVELQFDVVPFDLTYFCRNYVHGESGLPFSKLIYGSNDTSFETVRSVMFSFCSTKQDNGNRKLYWKIESFPLLPLRYLCFCSCSFVFWFNLVFFAFTLFLPRTEISYRLQHVRGVFNTYKTCVCRSHQIVYSLHLLLRNTDIWQCAYNFPSAYKAVMASASHSHNFHLIQRICGVVSASLSSKVRFTHIYFTVKHPQHGHERTTRMNNTRACTTWTHNTQRANSLYVHIQTNKINELTMHTFELVIALKRHRHRRNTVYQFVPTRLVLGGAVRVLPIIAPVKLRQLAPCEARKVRDVLMISDIKSFSLQYFLIKSF